MTITIQASLMNERRCEFWDDDSVMVCTEPAAFKMVYVGHAPYTRTCAQRYCKHHYELMAGIVRGIADSGDLKSRRRAQRTMEMNNWFQHE